MSNSLSANVPLNPECVSAHPHARAHSNTHVQAQLFGGVGVWGACHLVGVFKGGLVKPAQREWRDGEREQSSAGVKQVKELKGMSKSAFLVTLSVIPELYDSNRVRFKRVKWVLVELQCNNIASKYFVLSLWRKTLRPEAACACREAAVHFLKCCYNGQTNICVSLQRIKRCILN